VGGDYGACAGHDEIFFLSAGGYAGWDLADASVPVAERLITGDVCSPERRKALHASFGPCVKCDHPSWCATTTWVAHLVPSSRTMLATMWMWSLPFLLSP
jgi:hypothetical protein